MNEYEQMQENLRNLPKHSLNDEQKTRILLKLKEKQKTIKRKGFLQPLLVAIASLALFTFLVVHGINGDHQSTINTSEQNQTELTIQAGKEFVLSDTKQQVIGIEENVALLNTFEQFVAKDKRRVAKLMIFYWGDPLKLVEKNYRIVAKNGNGEEFTLAEGELNSALNSEDAHTLTSFEPFPTEGTWQLCFYVEETLHGTFTLDVLPAFPNTEHFTLMDSPKEFEIGKKTSITIESSLGSKEEIEVELINREGKVVDQGKFTQMTMQYDASTNKPVYLFNGNLSFPNQGIWTLVIDGEKSQPFNN